MAALLRFTSEARWLRHARVHLRHLFRYLPQQPGYNKRLRRLAPTIEWLITALACDTSLWTDDVWVVDSTPVECGRSRETARRSDLAGYAEYGYCASHSRYFWGLRLHLIATLHGLPVGFALTGAKADERHVVLSVLAADPGLLDRRHRQVMIADKNYYGHGFETTLSAAGVELLRPARKGERARPGAQFFRRCAKPSSRSSTLPKVNSTWKDTVATPSPALPSGSTSAPRPDRCDLAQRPHRPTHQTVTAGLRPLNEDLGITHPVRLRLGPPCGVPEVGVSL
jgi:hypothetical protein